MEQWKQDLNDLIRQPPGRDVKGVVQRIMRSKLDDRSTALTCAAFAEIGLAAGIAMVLQPDRDQVIDWFWKPVGKHGRGKYGSFDKKISAAFDLDLMGEDTRHNLEIVRRVRNAFAHSMADVRFTTPAIKAACELINSPSHLPKEKVRSRKSRCRFAYCQVCDQVFRIFLGGAALKWITGAKPQQRLLP